MITVGNYSNAVKRGQYWKPPGLRYPIPILEAGVFGAVFYISRTYVLPNIPVLELDAGLIGLLLPFILGAIGVAVVRIKGPDRRPLYRSAQSALKFYTRPKTLTGGSGRTYSATPTLWLSQKIHVGGKNE